MNNADRESWYLILNGWTADSPFLPRLRQTCASLPNVVQACSPDVFKVVVEGQACSAASCWRAVWVELSSKAKGAETESRVMTRRQLRYREWVPDPFWYREV